MPAAQFCCPYCQAHFLVDDGLAGRQVECPACAGVLTVPEVESAPPIDPPPVETVRFEKPPVEKPLSSTVPADPAPPPLPEELLQAISPRIIAPQETPTDERGIPQLDVLQSRRKIGRGSRAREIVVLSPEAKQHRRRWRSAIMMLLGLAVLIAALYLLKQL